MNRVNWIGVLAICLFGIAQAHAESAEAAEQKSLEEELSVLKADVVELNTAISTLEEEILYPPNTQLAVFISLDSNDFFQLDSIELAVDGRKTNSHVYSEQERKALEQGGIQRLHVGSLSPGEHQITATLSGKGAEDRYYRKQQSFTVTKEDGPERIELTVQAEAPSYDPQLTMKRW